MNVFKKPEDTEYNVLSLGAGVQSSALALMAAHGEITPTPDFAVFADVGAEPTEVYEWLETLKDLIAKSPHPYPVYTVSNGNLTEQSLTIRKATKGKYKGEDKVRRLIPAFGLMPDGSKAAAIGRSCTADFKVRPVELKMKELCKINRGQKNITVTQWIGISWDEIQRAKEARQKWNQHRFPLLENKITRAGCHHWMIKHGYPSPPRSACYYCPFHSDSEWRRMRDEDPKHFSKAIAFDRALRSAHKNHNKSLNMEVYLHNSCKPLDEIDFDNDEDKGQQVWDFQAECEGMCGV
jgi:hypothetical protein